MAEKNEYDYLLEGLSVDEQMTVTADNKGILTGPYGVVIDPKQKAAFKRNKSIASNLGISLSSNSSVEDFKKVAIEIAKQNAQTLQKEIPEYAQLKPEYKYILLDSKHHTGVTYKNLAKDLLAHQNNPSPATLAAVVKDSRRVDKVNGAAKTSAGFDNRVAKVLFRANLIDDIDTAKQLGLAKASDKAGLNLLNKFGVEARDVLSIEVAEQTQEAFEPVEKESAFPVKEGEKVQYVDQAEPIEDVGTLDEDTQNSLNMVDVPMTSRQRKDLADRLAKDLGVERKSGLFGMGMTIPGTKIGFSEGGLSGFMTQEPSGTVEKPTRKNLKDVLEKLDESKGDIAKGAAEFIPGVGEAMAVKRVSDAMDEKDYTGAVIETAAGALGLIPVVGDMAGKGVRTLKKADPLEIGINPAAEDGALLSNYTSDTARNLTEKAKNAKVSLNKELINQPVDAGRQVAVRLNINSSIPDAPKGLDKLQTLHDKTPKGAALSYVPFATVENVDFYVNQTGRRNIASKIKGLDVKEATGKFPAMSVNGQYNPTRNVLDEIDDDVVEIGFNPADKHLFVDMATGQAVKGADVATVIGNRVYAKGVTYMKKTEAPKPKSASDGTELPSEVRYRMKQGGAVPMKEQMSMFEDGGLMDEGNTIDPISGNDVPPGSTQEEVRDDIPAQLSEGEFVFPADVVRYIGLEKLMQMRQQAKMGLSMMDKMGQMGNSEEAVIPDDIPFELSDLDMDDDPVELQQGGLLGPATGISGYVPSQVKTTPPFTIEPPTTMPIAPPSPTPAPSPVPIAPTYTPATQQAVPTFTPEQMQDVSYPGVVQTPESAPQLVEIINPTTGEKRSITYIPGVTQLPEGFVLASEYDAPETPTVTPTVGQTSVREDTTSDSKKEEAKRAKMKLDNARLKMAEELFPFTKPANPFSVSTALGKLEPGTRTATGYIIGDNGEYLDPLTGEQKFFGLDSAKYAINPEDKPPFKVTSGGINEKFEKYFKDKAEKRGEFTANEKQQLKAAKTQKEKVDVAKKISGGKATFADIKPAKDKKDNDRVKKEITKRVTKAREDAVKNLSKKQKEEEEADTLAFKTGGLASKPKPKPKQMRSGGLASKK